MPTAETTPRREEANKWKKKYNVGSTYTCWWDPKNTNDLAMKNDGNPELWGVIWWGVFFLSLAGLSMCCCLLGVVVKPPLNLMHALVGAAEFDPAALAAAAREMKTLKDKFDEIDSDQSGVLEAEELKEMIKKVTGAEPSDYEVQAMMRSADADDNGTVDFDEFCEIYRKVKTGKLECAAFAQAMADFESLLDSLDDDAG